MSDFKDYFNEEYSIKQADSSLRDFLEYYLNYWKVIVFCVAIALTIAFVYIKYATSIYESSTTLLLKKDKSGSFSDSSLLQEFSFSGGTSSFIDDEIQVLKSIPLVTSVVRNLQLNVSVFRETELTKKRVELYKKAPFNILQYEDSIDLNQTLAFRIKIISNDRFYLNSDKDSSREYKFGQKITINNNQFTVLPNENFLSADNSFSENDFEVVILPLHQVVNSYRGIIKVEAASKASNVINISLNSNIQQKAKDFLDKLVADYIQLAIDDKKEIAINTADFIDERLKVLDGELSELEKNVESFKTKNKLTDITSEAKQFLIGQSEIEKQINENYIQLELIDYMLDYMSKNNEGLIPDNIGIRDASLLSTIQSHNDLYLKYKDNLRSVMPKNPVVVSLLNAIQDIRSNLLTGLQNQKQTLEISLKSYENLDSNFNQKIREIPKQEREFKEINRPQQTKEQLYFFLLQKREESKIASISILPSAKVINKANGLSMPVSPKKSLIFSVFFILGLLIPLIGIYIAKLLNNKIYSIHDLEKVSSIPVIGSISRGDMKERKIIEKNDRASIAESFRLLVTNLDFLTSNQDNKARTIVVSSTISGEGKSFVSANLAAFLAHSGNKVVLVGLDLRAPKLDEFFDVESKLGITHFIKDSNVSVNDIVVSSDVSHNLDLVFSGLIVPNFMEMTKSKRLKELFDTLGSSYDYIIVDSAPVGLASDTLMFSNFADLCLYVVRADYLDKRLIDVSERLKKENRFKKITLLLNDVDMENTKYGYGYGYGYGYDQQKSQQSRFSKWNSLFNRKK
jgi:tyrosine-protein kinase Etk/Wzc